MNDTATPQEGDDLTITPSDQFFFEMRAENLLNLPLEYAPRRSFGLGHGLVNGTILVGTPSLLFLATGYNDLNVGIAAACAIGQVLAVVLRNNTEMQEDGLKTPRAIAVENALFAAGMPKTEPTAKQAFRAGAVNALTHNVLTLSLRGLAYTFMGGKALISSCFQYLCDTGRAIFVEDPKTVKPLEGFGKILESRLLPALAKVPDTTMDRVVATRSIIEKMERNVQRHGHLYYMAKGL